VPVSCRASRTDTSLKVYHATQSPLLNINLLLPTRTPSSTGRKHSTRIWQKLHHSRTPWTIVRLWNRLDWLRPPGFTSSPVTPRSVQHIYSWSLYACLADGRKNITDSSAIAAPHPPCDLCCFHPNTTRASAGDWCSCGWSRPKGIPGHCRPCPKASSTDLSFYQRDTISSLCRKFSPERYIQKRTRRFNSKSLEDFSSSHSTIPLPSDQT